MRLNPQTARRLRRFRQLRRGWWSFLALGVLTVLALFGELLVNNRALIVRYQGHWYFPTYGAQLAGHTFGLGHDYEPDYRELQRRFRSAAGTDFVLLPPVPYNPYEIDVPAGAKPTRPPDAASRHFLGTDTIGRDILARLFYGFRIALVVSLSFLAGTYLLGIALGCAMGWAGGWFDLIMQRVIEAWSNLPFLLIVMILSAVLRPTVPVLIIVFVVFSWMGMTYYMRTGTYREKAREYVAAAQVLGAGPGRIIFRHILPNLLSTLITFVPFTIAGAIELLTALDFLGFGIPPPTPSWGELLQQGTQNLTNAPWIVSSAFGALVLVLLLVSFVGEAVREAFDPKKLSTYQ
jgi:microcin C transport system permease protein